MHTSVWSSAMMATIDEGGRTSAPLIRRADVAQILPGTDLWDFWPLQRPSGEVAVVGGGSLYMLLSAPALPDPDSRHAVARIRLMHHVDGVWRDRGPLLPDGWSPGSREWSGSAVLGSDDRSVTLYFTAAGRRGEAELSFEQRLFEVDGELIDDDRPAIAGWSEPREIVAPDGGHFMRDMSGGGAIGTIKAFRDPAYFRDPSIGREYILFTGSLAHSTSDWNGAIGVAERVDVRWRLRQPLITADGLNNELERPHVVVSGGRYYLFWSTQRKVFAPAGPSGPTGLYGMVADAFGGPWSPLNGSGLVIGNPVAAPSQAYSWLVLPDLSVLSFADMIELGHAPHDTAEARTHFGGTPAPPLRLRLAGDRATLV